jgi:hypothetical protein
MSLQNNFFTQDSNRDSGFFFITIIRLLGSSNHKKLPAVYSTSAVLNLHPALSLVNFEQQSPGMRFLLYYTSAVLN